MKKLLLIASVCFFVNVNAQTSKEVKTKELLELMGATDSMKQMLPVLIEQVKAQYPNVPQSYWDKFKNKIDTNELINLIVPVYDKYYTEAEIDQLVKFYKTPIGQKVRKVTPQVSVESMQAGQQWGLKIAQEIVEELSAIKQKNNQK
ncbi:DUF2059 domain-containing protein [Weeksellaceae bacterium TAE3-ERU29]|nr:DUF2059 domain-containing protein [Weeksellaceae bacterium TAE3-ERU29]